jgi:hypothetical protein
MFSRRGIDPNSKLLLDMAQCRDFVEVSKQAKMCQEGVSLPWIMTLHF